MISIELFNRSGRARNYINWGKNDPIVKLRWGRTYSYLQFNLKPGVRQWLYRNRIDYSISTIIHRSKYHLDQIQWFRQGLAINFEKEADAMLFKLRWL